MISVKALEIDATQFRDDIICLLAEGLDELVEQYLETLDDHDEVEMYLTPREYAEFVLCHGDGWYKQPGFVEWVQHEVLGKVEL